MRKMYNDLRYIARDFLQKIAVTMSANAPGPNHEGDQGETQDNDAASSASSTSSADANGFRDYDNRHSSFVDNVFMLNRNATSNQTNLSDDEVEHLRSIEFYRRLRILANELQPWEPNSTPSPLDIRPILLANYRTLQFVEDLAVGNHDGYSAALGNQEYDHYYSGLRTCVEQVSEFAASALQELADPHLPPGIALTIPPVYEPTDLPPYTATALPPRYSFMVPAEHATQDAPVCNERDCPVRILDIEHSRGLYHHDGQMGPVTHPQDTWLPSFGQSNPPPKVWCAYNFMVLGIARRDHHAMVAAFVRHHSHPWRSQSEYDSPMATQANNPAEWFNIKDSSSQRLEQSKRIPYPQRLIPIAEIENQGLEVNRDSMPSFVIGRELDSPERGRHRPTMPSRLGVGGFHDDYHQTSSFIQPVFALNHSRETIDRSAIIPPLRINIRRLDNVANSQQTRQLSESLNIDADSHDPGSIFVASANLTRILPIERSTCRESYWPDSLRPQNEGLRRRHSVDSAIRDHNGHQTGAHVVPPFPGRPEPHSPFARRLGPLPLP